MYNLRDTFRSMSRHKSLTFLSTLTIALTIFFLGVVALATINSQFASKEVENDLEIVAFCSLGIDEDGIKKANEDLDKIEAIETITFVSKEEALAKLNERFDKETDLKTSLDGENPLPDSFRIKVSSAEKIQPTVKDIEKIEHIDSVRYGENIVENVITVNKNIKIFSAIFIVAMVLGTLFLINSTISLTVSNRQREIEVMRYLGASNAYIRMPFFFEGIFIGLVGSLIAIGSLYFGYNKLHAYIIQHLPFMPIMNNVEIITMVLAALLAIGLVLGAAGSALATGRYLKK